MEQQPNRQVILQVLAGFVSGLLLHWVSGPQLIKPEQYEQLQQISRQDPILEKELSETLHQRIPTVGDYERLMSGHVLRRNRRDTVPPIPGVEPPPQGVESGDVSFPTERE